MKHAGQQSSDITRWRRKHRMKEIVGMSLDSIAALNLHKLAQRKEEGKLNGNGDDR